MRDGLVNYSDDLTPLLADIDTVQQHPQNFNNGDVEKIVESIEAGIMYRPIYVQKSTGYIFAGNHTWEACKLLGAKQIPVVYSDIDDETALRHMIGDNELARLARPDNHALLRLLEDLGETERGVIGTGFTNDSVENLRLALAELDNIPLGGYGQPKNTTPHQCPQCGFDWQGACSPTPEDVGL